MSRREVVEVHCDRCPRIEYKGRPKVDPSKAPVLIRTVALEARLNDYSISFNDLCGPCAKAVSQYIEQIGKKLTSMSPDRADKEIGS